MKIIVIIIVLMTDKNLRSSRLKYKIRIEQSSKILLKNIYV